MFNSSDPQQLYMEAKMDEEYTHSPNYIYKKLFDYHQYYEPLRYIRDAGLLHESCKKLANEMADYPGHKAWSTYNHITSCVTNSPFTIKKITS